MNTPLISIGIPAYKSIFLREAILSVFNQDYSNWELIIVDDESPNPIHQVVAEFENDARVRYYRNEKNLGGADPVANWNKCLEYAKGEYFCLLCDDDMYEPWCLTTMLALANRYPQCNTFRMRPRFIDKEGNTFDYYPSSPEWESAIDYIWHFEKGWRLQAITEWMFRTEHMRKTGCYEPLPMAWGSDYLSIFKFGMEGGIVSTTKITSINRRSEFQITLNCAKYTRRNILARNLYEKRIEELFGQNNDYCKIVRPLLPKRHIEYMTRELIWCDWRDWFWLLWHRAENNLSMNCFKKSIGRKLIYKTKQFLAKP